MQTSLKPSPYKVSTITATASLSCLSINPEALFESVYIGEDPGTNGFTFIEYGVKKGTVFHKGFHKKLAINRRKKKEGKRFDNQVTVIVRLAEIKGQTLPTPLSTNMKIFKNGNVQMTGLKNIDQGIAAMQYVINHIKESPLDIVDDKEVLAPAKYDIRLINSDFTAGIEIRRDKLFKIMQEEYDVFCTYEPCIYPGVKIQYDAKTEMAEGEGEVKRITIAVFQSGCIIITGARSYHHIDTSYDFICSVLGKHMTAIKKIPLPVAPSVVSVPLVQAIACT